MASEYVNPSVQVPRTIEEDRENTMDKNVVGMLTFLASEAVFFSLLILSYVYFHGAFVNDPAGVKALDPVFTFIFSICLFASSGTIYLSEKALEKGNQGGFRFWLGATVVLGAIFLVGQGIEYVKLFNEDITVSRNLFGTTFFTMTGFHGFHVFIGLIMLSALFIQAMGGYFKTRHSSAVNTISLYWHFVDLVWVVIFSIVYIWSFLASGASFF